MKPKLVHVGWGVVHVSNGLSYASLATLAVAWTAPEAIEKYNRRLAENP